MEEREGRKNIPLMRNLNLTTRTTEYFGLEDDFIREKNYHFLKLNEKHLLTYLSDISSIPGDSRTSAFAVKKPYSR